MSRNINEEFYGDKSFSYGGKYRLYDNFDKSEVKNNQITHEDYKTVLFRRKQMVHKGTKKLSANHNLYTADVKKISLSPFNDKKFILWNGEEYTIYTFGYYKTKDVSMEQ